MNRDYNFFLYVMEAETELAPFDDGGGADASPESTTPPADSAPPANDNAPPPLNDGGDDMSFDPTGDMGGSGGGDDMSGTGDDQSQDNNELEGGNKANESMSKKADDILNQKLYEQLCSRNTEVENIIESLQTLTPAFSHEFLKANEKYITKLKSALNKSKDYVITRFVDSKYGENMLFFNEINTLFTMICDEIDKNLKTFQKQR